MKKNLVRLMMLLVVVTVPFAFMSCSDDDDDDLSSKAQKTIVGTWRCEDNVDYVGATQYILVFNSDGTGYEKAWYTENANSWSGYYLKTVDIGTENFTYEFYDSSSWDFDTSSMSYVYNEDYTLYFTWENDVATKYKNENWLFDSDFIGYHLDIVSDDKIYIGWKGFDRQ